jgi:hypothetical protein
MVQDIYALCTEFAGGKAFHLDERAEDYLHVVLAHNIIIRRLLR